MSKKKGKKKKAKHNPEQINMPAESTVAEELRPRIRRKEFDRELEKLQVELVKLQKWVKIPLNIGDARVTGLLAIVGLYAAIIPLAIFAMFTTWRQMAGGPDAPIAALGGSVLPGDPLYVQFALALTCALLYFIFWYCRLCWD